MQHSMRRKNRQHKSVNQMLFKRQRNLLQSNQQHLTEAWKIQTALGIKITDLEREIIEYKNNIQYWKERFKQSQDWKVATQVIELHNQMAAILRRNQPRISPTEKDLANHIQVIEKFSQLITGKTLEQLMKLGDR